MVRRKNNRIAGEIDKLNEHEASALLNFISESRPARKSKSIEITPSDDIILTLSDAYENKRARQVFEWERVRRQNSIQRAA
jgi:hypothetical protein